MSKLVNIFLIILITTSVFGENNYDMYIDIQRAIDSDLSTENINTATEEIEELKEKLSYIASNPINVNNASRSELESLPFLDVSQVENLLEYIFDFGELKSIYELALIDGWDDETIKICSTFLTVRPAAKDHIFSFKDIFKNGENHMYIRPGGTIQKKKGYKNGLYLGYPYSLTLKYSFKHNDLSIGVIGSKSEGEPFDFKYNKGFDFYSAHIAFLNVSKHIKGIYIGDYRLQIGQGLVFKSNTSFSSTYKNAILYSDNIKPSNSTSETGYLRGLAISLGNNKLNFNIMTSHTQYNKNEGYHRTETDFDKRYGTPSYMLGGNFSFNERKYKIGISGYYDFFDKSFCIGADYRFRIKQFNIAGEIAIDKNFKVATINSLSINCTSNLLFFSIFRHYPVNFKSKFENSYSRNNMSNETGLCSGVEFIPFTHWKLIFTSDIFNFKFIKSNINKPSVGFNLSFKAIYSPSDNSSGYFKYNVLSKEKNISNSNGVKKAGIYYKHNFVLNYNIEIKNRITLKSTLVSSAYIFDSLTNNKRKTFGYMLGFAGGWKPNRGKINLTLGIAFFDIPSYDNVIYNYEPTLLYSYSSQQYYGIGCRLYFIIKIKPIKNLNVEFKIGDTYFLDRCVISSGNEEISGNHKTQALGVLNYVF